MARTRRQASVEQRRRTRLYPLVGVLVLLVVLAVLVRWVVGLVAGHVDTISTVDEQCVVKANGVSDQLTLEQSGNAAIIVAESIRRGLPARAATIALATAMQESRLANIDHGDRDSVGLFQQRPSQGWGTAAQIMDPWYSSGKFYDHLVAVPHWQSGDINDVAQAVQRSGVPDGYRKHVEAAKAWASALTGHSPAAVSCVDRGTDTPALDAAPSLVRKTFGSSVTLTLGHQMVVLNSPDSTRLWAATQLMMASTGRIGVVRVTVGTQTWVADDKAVASWQGTPSRATEAVFALHG